MILGVSIGNCIHAAGILNFLRLAETEGYKTEYLGSSVSISNLIISIKKMNPDIVALSYRLTPESAQKIFNDLKKQAKKIRTEFIFGGTKPVAEIAAKTGIFSKVFTGEESIQEIRNYLKGVKNSSKKKYYADTLADRINASYPYPLIRHHFGRPALKETIKGAKLIAESKVLDILSLGPDQNAQEHFFHPERIDKKQDGAGGVPLRKPEDLKAIYKASRCGNFPLVRCYAGTTDLIRWAEMSSKTIHNAWGAIPLCWYGVLDGRSERSLEETIKENQETIKWYAKRKIPVEVNESHQWSLRDAHDSLAAAMAFLAAYNAKALGVEYYVSQYMFNTPPGTSPKMDLAKMLAKKEMIESLQQKNFKVFTQVRAGLSSFSSDMDIAKGQLSASAVLSLALKPHILHVVGFSEGHHAVKAEELIESCKIIHGVLKNSLYGFPNTTLDADVQRRKKELIKEAKVLLKAIAGLKINEKGDPLTNPKIIAKAIKIGLLDAPHLKGNKAAKGEIITNIVNGKCAAVNSMTGKILNEAERIKTAEKLNV
jgi:hypothetical protein